jgi:hypothetical protein
LIDSGAMNQISPTDKSGANSYDQATLNDSV